MIHAVLNADDLLKLKGIVPDDVLLYLPECVTTFGISSRVHLAHFLAQCDHESAGFNTTCENLNYAADRLCAIFPTHFESKEEAWDYARAPKKIGARIYANRMGNGDEASGEGYLYRGRGYIQLTGKDNYRAFSQCGISSDVVANPDLVAEKYPLISAAWFWKTNHLNDLCTDISPETVKKITKRINGGYNGLEDRQAKTEKYFALLA